MHACAQQTEHNEVGVPVVDLSKTPARNNYRIREGDEGGARVVEGGVGAAAEVAPKGVYATCEEEPGRGCGLRGVLEGEGGACI